MATSLSGHLDVADSVGTQNRGFQLGAMKGTRVHESCIVCVKNIGSMSFGPPSAPGQPG